MKNPAKERGSLPIHTGSCTDGSAHNEGLIGKSNQPDVKQETS